MTATYDLVRNQVALFDFSSEARFFISGQAADEAVNSVITADLDAISELKVLNTVMIDDDANILAIIWVLKAEDGIWIIADPEKRETVKALLQACVIERTASFEDKTETSACLGIIGPEAQKLVLDVAGEDAIGIPYLGFEQNEQTGAILARVGYTGEYEYRFIFPIGELDKFNALFSNHGPAYGLGQGDIADLPQLMLEMRSLAHAAHIPDGTSPIQAGLHWMIDFRKDHFTGQDVINRQKHDPERKALMLLIDEDIQLPEACPIKLEDRQVGSCAYLAYSPTLGKTMILAYVETEFAWVGLVFDVEGHEATSVSAPLFITQTVANAQ